MLRKEGLEVCVVERWLPRISIRKDALGFGDLLACDPVKRRVVLIQVITAGNLAARIKKAKALSSLAAWVRVGGEAEFHGWRRGPKGRWFCRRVLLTAADMEGVEISPPIPRRKPRRLERTLFDDC